MIENVDGYHFDTPEERNRPRPPGQLTTALNPPDWPERGDRLTTHWCSMCGEEEREDDDGD